MGDHIVVDTRYYDSGPPSRQDVIVFKKDDLFVVKRVVGVAGDSVQGTDGVIRVNGALLDEPYVQHTGQPPFWMNNFGPFPVPEGTLFVLGDNRDVSLDSRSEKYGSVTVSSVIGRPLYVFGSDRLGKALP
jgi:signal peptidase I